MAAVPIIECTAGRCVIIGELDLPDAARRAVARSPDGDFDVEIVPFYVGKQADGRAVAFGIGTSGKARTAWARVQGFRPAAIVKGRR